MREILDTKRKALKINLNEAIYGTFAEIGAGQEVARNFFTAGAASGTVAKSMSAYDMAFSDAIYGAEDSGRYVSQSRLEKMLDHEYDLLQERLTTEKYRKRTFFAFANTVTTLNYAKTNEAHGWIGLRFQLAPKGEANEILFHIRLLDSDASLQQRVLGMIGVNLVYAAYYYSNDPKAMIESLADNLSVGSVEIDMISVKGPDFKHFNNILLNMFLIAKGYSAAAIFSQDGEVYQAKDLLYKKDVILYRRRYNQKAPIDKEKLTSAIEYIKKNENIKDENLVVLTEITLNDTINDVEGTVNLDEFVKRAEELIARKRTVIISNFSRHNLLAQYIARCKARKVTMLLNIANLVNIFDASNFGEGYSGQLLSYIGNLFRKNIQVYAFPHYLEKEQKMITTVNMPTSPEAKPLFDFLIANRYIIDVVV
ncbi:nicotinamide mononucleotide adenylyltransferase [Solitalea sp. MAHUQ-68]|uniref:Nicotinamide mononucleotide adenylyltransferase n=1 Tax=Solitalea agri TaxID=2953739 RepID=A0A9X2F2Z9_9SPHI|nr:nicotinamide mononucleotide adenylyltransferase [Solitalea agri]MCO4293286.1 nicotinamide mononucleotide adenylyltransferase [Solitalea agri]